LPALGRKKTAKGRGKTPCCKGSGGNLKKKPQVLPWGLFSVSLKGFFSAKNGHVCRLQSFRTLRNLKLYLIAFIKGFKPILLDGGEVYENITSVVPRNETIALFLIEPLYTTFGHYSSPPLFFELA
jgi:hypothetical protein